MKLHPHAAKGHLLVGIALILLSLGSLVASSVLDAKILPFLIFFFGVWGGVETGRYLEAWMGKRHTRLSRDV
jgi:hypothetical protein